MKFYIIHRFEKYVHILYNNLYGIKYMITYHFLYESLNNLFMFHNFQSPNSFPQVFPNYICFIPKFVLISSQYKLLSPITL
jgi:hypothetical protein